MSKQTFIARFALIIKRLERGPATFSEIAHYLESESDIHDKNYNLSIRTLQRDIRDIHDQLDIEIVNEKKGDKRYYIKSRPEGQEYSRRLLEAYDMLNIVKEAQQNNRHVFFEPRRPNGLEHFSRLLHACTNKKILSFTHFKYSNNTPTNRIVHPLALKEARGRWYLVAVDNKDKLLKTFGLDRMDNLEISKINFRDDYNIDIEAVFNHSFGVINEPGAKPEKIILSLSYEQGQYLVNYPLHHTQRLVRESKDEMILEVTLLISIDLIMELQSFGSNLQVISPQSLRNLLFQNAKKVIALYESEN